MASTPWMPQPRNPIARIAYRVARWLNGSPAYQPPPPPSETSTMGVGPEAFETVWDARTELAQLRSTIYREMRDIDLLMPEGARALDILADNAVNAPEGQFRSFRLRFDDGPRVTKATQGIINAMVERTLLQEKVYPFARSALKYGDCFVQVVVDDTPRIVRLWDMPPESMVRNEDSVGLLKRGNTEGEWAFEQYAPDTNKFITGFYPWQIQHIRWNRTGESKYGRPALLAARYPFRKLQAMEEALVINWLTRAFARLLFQLDVTGKSEVEARQYVAAFAKSFQSRSTAADAKGIERLTVAKDLIIATNYLQSPDGTWEKALNDVKVLDTSNTGFWNIAPLEYWRNKFITATGVPRAHLGLEKDLNGRSTLQWEDARFSRTVRRVQMVMSEFIHHVIALELILHDIDPRSVTCTIEWPSPSTTDETDAATNALNLAKAAEILSNIGLFNNDWLRQKYFGVSPSVSAQQELTAKPQKERTNGDDDRE
jgi:hypothetical protein